MINKGVSERVCSRCGATEKEILSGGFLGCERCYASFSDVLISRIANVQQSSVHVGKRPRKEAITLQDEYHRLEEEVKRAISVEDYQRATALQTQMRTMRDNQWSGKWRK